MDVANNRLSSRMNGTHIDSSNVDSNSEYEGSEKYEPATDDDNTLRNHEAADESKQLQQDVDLEHTMDNELAGNKDREWFKNIVMLKRENDVRNSFVMQCVLMQDALMRETCLVLVKW